MNGVGESVSHHCNFFNLPKYPEYLYLEQDDDEILEVSRDLLIEAGYTSDEVHTLEYGEREG